MAGMKDNVPEIGGVSVIRDASVNSEFDSEVMRAKEQTQNFANVGQLGKQKDAMPEFKPNPTRSM